MLDTDANLKHTILHELLRIHELRFKLIVFVTRAQYVVAAHTPSVSFIALTTESIIIVTIATNLRDTFAI